LKNQSPTASDLSTHTFLVRRVLARPRLQNLLLEDLVKRWDEDRPVLKRNPPCYIVIDPKGLMIERLSKLSFFSDTVYKDKLVIIDPLDHPALNLFKTMGRDPAQLISDFSYISQQQSRR